MTNRSSNAISGNVSNAISGNVEMDMRASLAAEQIWSSRQIFLVFIDLVFILRHFYSVNACLRVHASEL